MKKNIWLQRDFALAWGYGWLARAETSQDNLIDAMFLYYLRVGL
jgi:hypothetical protein